MSSDQIGMFPAPVTSTDKNGFRQVRHDVGGKLDATEESAEKPKKADERSGTYREG